MISEWLLYWGTIYVPQFVMYISTKNGKMLRNKLPTGIESLKSKYKRLIVLITSKSLLLQFSDRIFDLLSISVNIRVEKWR